MATTLLSNLVNPQVLSDMINTKLVDLMRFAPLATIDYTLQGAPGNAITLPTYSYIGDAAVLNENSELTPVALTASTVTATIHKIAKGVEITDEALLSAYGSPEDEISKQLALALASKMDNEMLVVLNSIASGMTQTPAASTGVAPSDINLALEKFGEDIDMAEKVCVVAPALYTQLRTTTGWLPASEISANRLIKGSVGEAYGCQIIVSNKLTVSGNAYIVMPGALRYFLKRDTLIEQDRDILYFKNVYTASKHGVCYLYDASRAIKIGT